MCIASDIRQKIHDAPCGAVFFISDFSNAGNEVYISRFLSEMVAVRELDRLANGIYYKPTVTKFGVVRPQIDQVIEAIARRDKAKIMPTGQTSEYLLGLSTQMPMNYVYLTTGSARQIKIGPTLVTFKRSVPKNFAYKGKLMPVLVQAMKSIGLGNITKMHRSKIFQLLKEHMEADTIGEDMKLAPIWIGKMLSVMVGKIRNDE